MQTAKGYHYSVIGLSRQRRALIVAYDLFVQLMKLLLFALVYLRMTKPFDTISNTVLEQYKIFALCKYLHYSILIILKINHTHTCLLVYVISVYILTLSYVFHVPLP